MNKNAFFDLSVSDTSSSEDSEDTIETTLFETLFHDEVLARQVVQFDPEAFRLNRLVEALAADLYDEQLLMRHINNINRYLEENVEQTMMGVLLAKMLISCKHYIATKLDKEIDTDELQFAIAKTQSINQIMSRIAPNLKLFHHNSQEPGIVRIEFSGQAIAFFKVGILRQQNDQFLHHFYLHIKEQMQLDEAFPEVFPASTPISIALAQINFSEHEHDKESLYFSSIERDSNAFYEHCVNANPNSYSDWACVSGGIQAALSPWDVEQQPMLNLLVMLSLVLILGGRDVRENGIMARGTIIDFEDFLEVKNKFPGIHIPFIADFSHQQPDLGHWRMLADYLKQLDWLKISSFMTQYSYQTDFVSDSVLNLCRGDVVDQARSEYVYRRPTFSPSKLLSREQITLCHRNIEKLRQIVDKICAEQKVGTSLFQLIASFDPSWEEQVFQLDAMRHSMDDGIVGKFYDEKTIKQYSKSVGASRHSPELMAGNISRTPSPTMNQTELFAAFSASLGTVITKANIANLARSLDAVDFGNEDDALKLYTK